MNINELADLLDCEIEYRRYPNQNGRVICHFKDCDVKDGGMLVGAYGTGTSPDTALADYVNRLQGNLIVFRASNPDKRREFRVPKTLMALHIVN